MTITFYEAMLVKAMKEGIWARAGGEDRKRDLYYVSPIDEIIVQGKQAEATALKLGKPALIGPSSAPGSRGHTPRSPTTGQLVKLETGQMG